MDTSLHMYWGQRFHSSAACPFKSEVCLGFAEDVSEGSAFGRPLTQVLL